MKLLALDTSTEHCSAALWLDGAVLQRLERAGQRHSERLLPMVAGLLAEAGVSLRDLDAVAAAVGPGSFTGLRIATSVGQGLALGARLPVVPVGTLEALAAAAPGERVVACLDARMGEVYAAAWVMGEGRLPGKAVFAPRVCLPGDLPALPGEDWHGCGSGFEPYGDAMRQALGGVGAVDASAVPQARWVAHLAAARFAAGERHAPEALVPVYLRDRVALTRAER